MDVIDSLERARSELPRTVAVFERGRERGLHLGIQLYVSRDLNTLVDLAIGENQPGEPLTSDHLLPWLSAGKPLTALAVMQLVDEQRIDLDRPVVQLIPEFGQAGKEAITSRHLLTHTAGIDAVMLGWPQTPWDEIITRICAAPLRAGTIPGESAAYDPQRSWFILGEIVQRLRGRPIAEVLRENVLQRLGMMETWLALPVARYADYAPRLGRIEDEP